ncbi:MAG TPA: hypothetical protein VEV17_25565 [Bryobacteraceae bacterium]|nr:hypothetical protein [Bryobacteraceae bacterium]
MKRLHLAAGLLVVASCMGLQAQVLDARAEVPFDFWLGQKLMPAGEYLIYHMGTGAVMLQERRDTRASAIFLAQPTSRADRREGTLEFTRYGNAYFLSKIWNPYETDGYAVPKSSREKEIASHVPSSTAGIALLRK